ALPLMAAAAWQTGCKCGHRDAAAGVEIACVWRERVVHAGFSGESAWRRFSVVSRKRHRAEQADVQTSPCSEPDLAVGNHDATPADEIGLCPAGSLKPKCRLVRHQKP